MLSVIGHLSLAGEKCDNTIDNKNLVVVHLARDLFQLGNVLGIHQQVISGPDDDLRQLLSRLAVLQSHGEDRYSLLQEVLLNTLPHVGNLKL